MLKILMTLQTYFKELVAGVKCFANIGIFLQLFFSSLKVKILWEPKEIWVNITVISE